MIIGNLNRSRYKIGDLLEISFTVDKVITEVGVDAYSETSDSWTGYKTFDLSINGIDNLETEVIGNKTFVKYEYEIKNYNKFGFDAYTDQKREVMINFENYDGWGVDHKKNPYKVLFFFMKF